MFDSSESSSSDEEIVRMCVETDEEIQMWSDLIKDKRLSAREHLAVFLWFAGHEGTSFRDLSDRFNISTSTVSVIIDRVCNFLSNMSPNVIKWPNEEQKVTSSTAFKNECGFSKVIECIDGTHITIDKPLNLKNQYIDRKGNVSICMQEICNEKKKFISIFVGYPGSSHDSWIYQNSTIFNKINSYCGENYLLGDSAYPCSKHLITPYRDNGHLTINIKLSSARVSIEHTFGILKQRFRQLYYCKLKGVKKVCHFIRACCVLHNISSENDLDFIYVNSETNSHEVVILPQEEHITGNAFRELICSEIQ
ncbi:putative nuclease HARBI1 [Lucilia cuprina]|nr:putative nuclease HARBI1 [Lucilia cuprina]